MEDNNRKLAKDRQLFHGAMGAGLSHEINNVFAIIGELDGLLQDLSAGTSGQGVAPQKLKSVLSKIDAQVERGKVLVKLLNQFSHSTEIEEQDLVVSDVLRHMIELSGRLARLRRVTFHIEDEPADNTIHGDLFNLQHILFRCIEIALLSSGLDAALNVALSGLSTGVSFAIINDNGGASSEEIEKKNAIAVTIARRLGGELEVSKKGTAFQLVLFLPSRLNPLVS
jgi:C4-dicarboxylate-specific signal transduction histidine kinase